MPARSKIEGLPAEVRAWLDKALADNGFSKYELLSELLKEKGFEISKSALHRHGTKVERRLAAVRASTAAAREIASAVPDEADDRSNAVMSMIQTDLFNVLVDLQDAEEMDPAEKAILLAKLGRTIAPMVGASLRLKKFTEDIHARTQDAAEKVAKLARKGGLAPETVATIRRDILGITS